jgi:hypothetical protein
MSRPDSNRIINAVIAFEDRKFWHYGGKTIADQLYLIIILGEFVPGAASLFPEI